MSDYVKGGLLLFFAALAGYACVAMLAQAILEMMPGGAQ